MLPQQQLQNAFPLNKQQAAPTKAQQKLCPFCNKTYSLIKIFNYKSSEKSKYKRYYHTHSNCCTNPKGSNYCYDSNGIPGKKYCSNACLTCDSVDSKMEQETALIMNLIQSVQKKIEVVNNQLVKTMNDGDKIIAGKIGEKGDHVQETSGEIKRVFQRLSSRRRETAIIDGRIVPCLTN